MFYRPGGSAKRINAQQDTVYTDTINGATGWLPINEGDAIAVNVSRARLTFQTVAQSIIAPSPFNPEADVLLELKMYGGNTDAEARPIDLWQNLVVACSRRARRAGWVRLRVININNSSGDGVALDLQISRTGNTGVGD